MKRGFAIAFFVLCIIACVFMIGKPWSLFEETLVTSVTNSSDDEIIAEIEDRIYELGGIEWAYVYRFADSLEISVEARDYDPQLFPDFAQNVCDEVEAIMNDYEDIEELGYIYISEYNSVTEDSISWYTNNGKRGYFVYTHDGEDESHDNMTLDEVREFLEKKNISAMGGAL